MERRPVWRRTLRNSSRIGITLLLGLPTLAVSAGAVGLGALVYGNLEGTIPEPKPVRRLEPSHVYVLNPDGTKGEEIASFREFELALPMKRDDVPHVLKDAVVASEDRQFWTHKGVDPIGIGRAAYVDVIEGQKRQGGSTITQQLIRERFLTREQTLERKFNEVLLATRFERDLVEQVKSETGLEGEAAEKEAKERILFDYLNTIYFGSGAYGAQAAAQTYFHKNVNDLTVAEAATLVGIIPSPSAYSPRENISIAEDRRKLVLQSMREVNYLTDEEYHAAVNLPLWPDNSIFGAAPKPTTTLYGPPPTSYSKYPYYVDFIRRYLTNKYGADELYHGGLEVLAAIDPRMQDAAEAAVGNTLAGTEAPLEMSLVSVEPQTGMVKALVGGRDYARSQVNLALGGSSGMAPGSSFKAFVVARAFEERMTDKKVYFAGDAYQPKGCVKADCIVYNSEPGEGGALDMRTATALSVNTYFVPFIEEVGPQEVAELAHRVGVTRIDPARRKVEFPKTPFYDYQLAVGRYEVSPLDMAVGYGTFANRGIKADPVPVARVTDRNGKVIEDNTKPHGTQVIEPGVADWTSDVLRGPIERGTATGSVKLDRVAAGKTGTADSHRAAWFVGYVPQLSTAVWMGYSDKPAPLKNIKGVGDVFGGGFPAQTWNAYMNEALKGVPVQNFVAPVPLAPLEPGTMATPSGEPPKTVTEEVRKAATNRPRVDAIPEDCGGPCVATGGGGAPRAPAPGPAPTTVPPTKAPTTAAPTTRKAAPTTTKKGSP